MISQTPPGEVIPLPGRATPAERSSARAAAGDLDALAAALGSPADWRATAVDVVRRAIDGRQMGIALVPITALRLLLARIDELEQVVGDPEAAA